MKTEPKERPILFSGPMVRAILEGRKTQTRRVVKLTDTGRVKAPCAFRNWHLDDPNAVLACPYGEPSDRLWVRETWGIYDGEGMPFGYPSGIPKELPEEYHVSYPADDADGVIGEVFKWRPSIHMPRWASRILLEVVSVRVERLQEISEEDAEAEGVEAQTWEPTGKLGYKNYTPELEKHGFNREACMTPLAKDSYFTLWEAINGKGSWDDNPWVWVVEFKRLEVSK